MRGGGVTVTAPLDIDYFSALRQRLFVTAPLDIDYFSALRQRLF